MSRWGKGRGGRPWRRKRDAVLLRDQYTCQVCLKVTEELQADHIIPRAKGGSDDEDNLRAICVDCHKVKTAAESRGGTPCYGFDAQGQPIDKSSHWWQ